MPSIVISVSIPLDRCDVHGDTFPPSHDIPENNPGHVIHVNVVLASRSKTSVQSTRLPFETCGGLCPTCDSTLAVEIIVKNETSCEVGEIEVVHKASEAPKQQCKDDEAIASCSDSDEECDEYCSQVDVDETRDLDQVDNDEDDYEEESDYELASVISEGYQETEMSDEQSVLDEFEPLDDITEDAIALVEDMLQAARATDLVESGFVGDLERALDKLWHAPNEGVEYLGFLTRSVNVLRQQADAQPCMELLEQRLEALKHRVESADAAQTFHKLAHDMCDLIDVCKEFGLQEDAADQIMDILSTNAEQVLETPSEAPSKLQNLFASFIPINDRRCALASAGYWAVAEELADEFASLEQLVGRLY